MMSEAKCKRTRERGAEHSRLLSCATLAWLLATAPNGELARGLSLRLRVRLGRCHVKLHYGTVLWTLPQLLLAITGLRRRLGTECLSLKTVPWCNSTQHRPNPTRSLTCPPARTRIIWCYGTTSFPGFSPRREPWERGWLLFRRNHERDCNFVGTDRKPLQIWATMLRQKWLLIANRVWYYWGKRDFLPWVSVILLTSS